MLLYAVRLLVLGAGTLGKGSTGRQLPLHESVGGCCRAEPAVLAGTRTGAARVWDGEGQWGGSGSAPCEHGAVGVRMQTVSITG